MMHTDEPLIVKGYTISPGLFTQGYREGHGPCTCTSVCCSGGVYADITERDAILAHKEMIGKYLDETQPADPALWFEQNEADDGDFPSGRCVGTTEHNSKCAFLDRFGRCSIQVASVEEGMDRWALKPLYCILFPIEITARVISFDDLLQDEQDCCSIGEDFSVPIFRACRDEFVHLLGEDGFQQMEDHYEQHYRAARRAPGIRATS
jgi:hypothetical protein